MSGKVDTQDLYSELDKLYQAVQFIKDRVELLGQAVHPTIRTEHPHIVRIEGVHGGRPTIRGTGISVQTIVEQTRLGRSPQQVVEDYEIVTMAQIYDALSYYYEHPQEIEQYITENREALWANPMSA
jgi:uncharacterized protein (DUF433 family)